MLNPNDTAGQMVRSYLGEILHDVQITHAQGVLFGLCPRGQVMDLAGWHVGDPANIMDRELGQEVVARVRSHLERLSVDCAIRHAPGVDESRRGLVLGWKVTAHLN